LAEDRWYFDVPLAIRLHKPLRSRRWWLVNARILVDKSESRTLIGQMMMNQYYPHLPSARTVRNASLGKWIGSAQKYILTNLMNLWSSRMMGPGWKISSCALWCCISLLCICWCRWPSYYSWQKMKCNAFKMFLLFSQLIALLCNDRSPGMSGFGVYIPLCTQQKAPSLQHSSRMIEFCKWFMVEIVFWWHPPLVLYSHPFHLAHGCDDWSPR
jgi:hypothetical protein